MKKTSAVCLIMAAAWFCHIDGVSALTTVEQGEDPDLRAKAIRLHEDLKDDKVRFGHLLKDITKEYGDAYKSDIDPSISELRYRYSKDFNQGYVYIFLLFDKDRKLIKWRVVP